IEADATPEWTDRTVWHNRLRRDGWSHIAGAEPETWLRPHSALPLTLAMTMTPRALDAAGGRYQTDYAVLDLERDLIARFPSVTWADWDQRGRLALAREGRLVLWERDAGEQLLADFNGQSPDPQPAPDDARVWTRRPARR